ncbi:unnamed protein product [Sphagnum compactum]
MTATNKGNMKQHIITSGQPQQASRTRWWRWIWLEVRKQCVIAGPMVCTNLLQYSITIVAIIYVGHLGELELSSASIATSFASVTGYTLLLGMGSGLETLCGQAYGAHQYESVGVYLQAAIFCMLLVCIPVAVLWFNMESLLLLMGQDQEISAMAGMYFGWLVPSLFGVAMLHPLLKFLQSQSVVLPMMLCSLFAVLFHIALCYILIYTLDVGFIGAALATTISYWLNAIFLMLYVKFSVICKKTWRGLSTETFSAVKPFMKLAIPSAFMICLEYWSFELLVLLSGLLPNPKIELSVLSICLNTAALTYMIPFGVSAAVSTRVSNELGAGQPDVAKFSVKIGLGLSSIQALIIASTLLIVRNLWGNIFSSSDEVVDYVAKILPLLAITSFMDGIQGVLSGVARGCGWQEYAAYANLGAFYGVGMPTAVILAFVFHLNGWGLWLGLACGLFVQMSSLFIMTIRTDWAKQADYAKGRLDNSSLKHLLITSAEPAEV